MFGLNCAKRTAALCVATAAAAATALLGAPGAVAAPQPIVGGTTTTTTAYPFMMQITDASQNQFCGGTLVAANKVVTAAHCVVGETTSSVRVVGGRTYLNGTNGTVSKVSKIWINPDYTDATNGDDVAVLTLSTSMSYTPASYVASTDTGVYATGATARIIGWGTTSESGSSSNQLRTATVPIVSNSSCAAPTAPNSWPATWSAPVTPTAVPTPARATAAVHCSSAASSRASPPGATAAPRPATRASTPV